MEPPRDSRLAGGAKAPRIFEKEAPPRGGAPGKGRGNRVSSEAPRCQDGAAIGKESPATAGENQYRGEFDPGSERTLAARLKHASRAAG